MIQVELYYMTFTIAMKRYLSSIEELMLWLVCKPENSKTKITFYCHKETCKCAREVGINPELDEELETTAKKQAKRIKQTTNKNR